MNTIEIQNEEQKPKIQYSEIANFTNVYLKCESDVKMEQPELGNDESLKKLEEFQLQAVLDNIKKEAYQLTEPEIDVPEFLEIGEVIDVKFKMEDVMVKNESREIGETMNREEGIESLENVSIAPEADSSVDIGTITVSPVQSNGNLPDVKTFKCGHCDHTTKRRRDLKRHALTHTHPSDLSMLTCGDCTYQTPWRSALKRHKLIHQELCDIEMYTCDECDYRSKSKQNLQSHTLRHKDKSEVRMFRCAVCHFETKHRSSLRLHLLQHKVFYCGECDYSTKTKNLSRIHLRLHRCTSGVETVT